MSRRKKRLLALSRTTFLLNRLSPVHILVLLLLVAGTAWGGWQVIRPGQAAPLPPITSPLRVNPANNRFFVNGSGKAVVLAGMHTWTNLQDADNFSAADPPPPFDWNTYLNTMIGYGQNFMRMWNVDYTDSRCGSDKPHNTPTLYQRTGPGNDTYGKPKFDLTKFNQAYFDRLKARVADAQSKGVYVGLMLFQGNWGYSQCHWDGNPMNPANNINGINVSVVGGTRDGQGYGSNIHTLQNPALVEIHKAYLHKVIDTVGEYNNVLWEISNEEWGSDGNVQWAYAMIDYIHQYEATKSKRHPVGMTPTWNRANGTFYNSNAEWISPCDCKNQPDDGNGGQSYRSNPEPANGRKVIITDTDHYFGVGGDQSWAWKSFTRGLNPIYMYKPVGSSGPNGAINSDAYSGGAFHAMGDIVTYGNKMNLAQMTPRGDLASTGYALANPGQEYLVYQPNSGALNVNLAGGTYSVEWLNPASRAVSSGGTVTGGTSKAFTPPFSGQAVLYLRNQATPVPPPPAPTTPPPASPPTPTSSPNPIPPGGFLSPDLNGDGKVNLVDLSMLMSKWGTADSRADLNRNGKVDLVDLSIMMSKWNR